MMMWASTSVAWPFVVPTGSMEDNVLVGDHLIVDKLSFAPNGGFGRYLLPYTEVRRGDVVVFRYPLDIRQDYVKRVIGVPGDHVKLVAKQLYLNGKPMDEPYKFHKTDYLDSYRDYFPSEPNVHLPEPALKMLRENVVNGELIVPPGKYFVMGDNRDNSSDGRYWGFVPRENIFGKPWLIYWSYDAPTQHLTDAVSFAHILDLGMNFFSKTRWKRTFKIIKPYPLG
jgi:signal peptidase I